MMETIEIQTLVGIAIPTGVALISYGVLKAKTNGYGGELHRLDKCKAERGEVELEFKSVNEKLDRILNKLFSD